jgi:hypothetical protein
VIISTGFVAVLLASIILLELKSEGIIFGTKKKEGTVYILSKQGKPISVGTFYGRNFGYSEIKKENDKLIFQDFNQNCNLIQNMWASVHDESYINTRLIGPTPIDDKMVKAYDLLDSNQHPKKMALSVEFKSHKSRCNVMIRPNCVKRFICPETIHALIIEARGVRKNKDDNSEKIAFGVRLVNGYYQHWTYGKEEREYNPFELENELKRFVIDLKKDRSQWFLYPSDGNWCYDSENARTPIFYHNDVFKQIIGISLEFGAFGTPHLAASAEGIVEIFNIYFE